MSSHGVREAAAHRAAVPAEGDAPTPAGECAPGAVEV